MAGRALTKSFYDALVNAFRETPGRPTVAANKVGCDKRTASRGWYNGWPRMQPWALPIMQVLKDEKAANLVETAMIRTRANKESEAILAAATKRSAEAAKRESDSQIALAETVLGMSRSVARILPGLDRLCEVINDRIELAASEPSSVELIDAVGLVSEMTKNGERLAKMHSVLMETQRLALNQPQKIVGYADLSGITAVEAAAESRRLMAEFAEAEAREARGGIEGVVENADGTAIVPRGSKK